MLCYICRWFHSIIGWSVAVPTYNVLDVFDFVDVSHNAIEGMFYVVLGLFLVRFISCRR